MRCDEVSQNLDLLIRQELAPPVRERIEGHLRGCGRCREELARLRRLEELLAADAYPPVPVGFAARVVARARREVPSDAAVAVPRTAGWRIAQRMRMAAGAAAALAGGLLLGGYLGTQTWNTAPPSVRQTDPLAGLGLRQLVEPGGDSLAQTYLALTSGGDG